MMGGRGGGGGGRDEATGEEKLWGLAAAPQVKHSHSQVSHI